MTCTTKRINVNKHSTNDVINDVTDDTKAGGGLSQVVTAVKSVCTNGPYMFAMLYGTVDAILVNGLMAFGAKYIQQQFGRTSSVAGIVYGMYAFKSIGRNCFFAGLKQAKAPYAGTHPGTEPLVRGEAPWS